MATEPTLPMTGVEFNENISLVENDSRPRFQFKNCNKINDTCIMEDIKIKLLFDAFLFI
jgi:hypothetical protein